MRLDNGPESILRTKEILTVETNLLRVATEAALLGEIDVARKLTDLYFHETQNLTRHYEDSGLKYAWKTSGAWPEHIPANEKSDASLVSVREAFDSRWEQIPEKDRTNDAKGVTILLRAVGEVETLGTYGHLEKRVRYGYLAKALDIAMTLDPPPGTNESLGPLTVDQLPAGCASLVRRISQSWCDDVVDMLSEAEHLWPYYIRGLIADAMGISQETVTKKAEAALHAFVDRLTNGPTTSELKGKSMRDLLQAASDMTLDGAGAKYWEEEDGVTKPDNMFRNAATEDGISKLEEKLGIALPEDYKSFLRITDGFGSEETESGIYNGYFTDPPLKSVEDVEWSSEEYFIYPIEPLEISREVEELAPLDPESESWRTWGSRLPSLSRVLLIGTCDTDNVALIEPREFDRARKVYKDMYADAKTTKHKRQLDRAVAEFCGNWENFEKIDWACAEWNDSELSIFQSFRAYLEDSIESGSVEKED